MSPRRKAGEKMKYWGFYASDALKAETQRIATDLDESDADYIRKAVEQRNAQYKQTTSKPKMLSELSTDDMGDIAKRLRQSQFKSFPKGDK